MVEPAPPTLGRPKPASGAGKRPTLGRYLDGQLDGRTEVLRAAPTTNGDEVSVRWALLHVIEEYARHNGHADLPRQRIDRRHR